MSKKNYTMIYIGIVSAIIILVAGITYAYITSKTEKNITTGTGKLDIDYSIVQNITSGSISPSNTKEDGLHGIVQAKLKTNSVASTFNLYITPSKLANELKISALKWEVYGTNNSQTVYTNIGDFSTASINTAIKIVDSYELLSTDTTFDIYIWLDGNLVTGSVVGKEFTATISADSTPITGSF